MESGCLIEIRDCGDGRGRGVFATAPLPVGHLIYSARPTIAVLYSDHVLTRCASCFRGNTTLVPCTRCRSYSLCHDCADAWGAHATECAWFMTLPDDVRHGETDYVRFLLRYAALAQAVDGSTARVVDSCCNNEAVMSAADRNFARSYAAITARHFAPYGLTVTEDALRNVLLRVKHNALGFPFSSQETLGWAIEGVVCAINHDCCPNAALRQEDTGHISVVALRDIDAREEISISYIALADYPDAAERQRVLGDRYGFRCMCSRCREAYGV